MLAKWNILLKLKSFPFFNLIGSKFIYIYSLKKPLLYLKYLLLHLQVSFWILLSVFIGNFYLELVYIVIMNKMLNKTAGVFYIVSLNIWCLGFWWVV